jgi:hypothetical protein
MGSRDRSTPIMTATPLPEMLTEYYSQMLAGARNDQIELVLVVYHFEITDKATGGEVGSFYFDGDFFGSSNNKYVFLGKADSLYMIPASGWDVTRELLLGAKRNTSAMLATYAAQQLKRNYDLSEQSVMERRQQLKNLYPIYQTKEYKKGVYYTVEQFLNNNPVDTPFVKSVEYPWDGKREIYYHYAKANGKKGKALKGNTYFAIYDGEEWAVPVESYAQTMHFRNGEFYANVLLQLAGAPLTTGSGAAVGGAVGGLAGGIVGGVIGGVVGGAIEANTSGGSVYKARFDPESRVFVPQKFLY